MIFDYIDQGFINASKVIGLPDDQLKVVFCWLICVPLGFLHKKLTDPYVRNLYGLCIGIFLQYMCMKEYVYLNIFSALIVYAMAKILGKKCDWPSFFFLFTILIAAHIYRFIYDYYGWKMDGVTSLMIFFCKMTYFTFNYCDDKVEIPTLLDFLGYLYFFPSAIVGPVFSLQTYIKFIYLKDQYQNIPSSVKVTFKQVTFGCLYLAALQIIGPYFEINYIFSQEWYQNLYFPVKMLVWHPIIFFVQIVYLGAWKFAQAGMNACGISYEGKNKDGVESFDHIITVKDSYLLDYNPTFIIAKWNQTVQLWLKDVFYTRFSKSFSPQKSLLLVFTISALWHGVHPMYFLSFIHFCIYSDIAKFLYRAQDKFKWVPRPIVLFVQWYGGKTAVNYFGLGFKILEVEKVHQVYMSVYYFFTIIPLAIHLFFTFTKYGQRKKQIKKQENQEVTPENQKKHQ